MALQDLILVDDANALERALAGLEGLDPVGVDVERADWDRYWRAAALIQIGGAGRVVLVDPLAIDDLSLVDEFLRGRTVVLHAMENDLVPLAASGVTPPVVDDTAIAAAVLGLPTGLEGLLADLVGVELAGDKQAMQRADWEARPLSPQMLSYAAGDVADLPELWEILATRLEETGRTQWYLEEREAVRSLPPVEDRRDWSRTKGIGRLDSDAQGRARALWEARERLARDTDTAPGRIVADRALVDLAATPPRSTQELGRRGVRRQAVRQFGADLVAALAEGPAPVPVQRPRRRTTDADRANAERLRSIRAERAEALGIESGILCPSRTLLSALLTDPQTPEELRAALGLRDWQWEQLGPAFCDALGLGDDDPVIDRQEPDNA